MPINQERLAFDVSLEQKRIFEAKKASSDPVATKKIAVAGIANDWSGFAWEYGLKNKLRFTPFEHRYYQIADPDHFEYPIRNWRMVCEEDLDLGTDFISRLDKQERGGLIAKQAEQVQEKFFQSKVGDRFMWASPLSEDFSGYSFLYYAEVKESSEGKVLEVHDFLNSLDSTDFNRLFNLPEETLLEELMAEMKDTDLGTSQAVWEKLTETSPTGRIFNKSLDEILQFLDEPLMKQVKARSLMEAERIYDALEAGVSISILQQQVGQRLLDFVFGVTGEQFTGFASGGGIDGSCGRVDFGSSGGAPDWVEYSSITGEFKCKLCDEKLKRSKIDSHRCKC